MLEKKWKGGQAAGSKREAARAGQIRSFRIVKLDPCRQEDRAGTGVNRSGTGIRACVCFLLATAAALTALLAVRTFWYLFHSITNVPFTDGWVILDEIRRFREGSLHWTFFWAPYWGQRNLVARLLFFLSVKYLSFSAFPLILINVAAWLAMLAVLVRTAWRLFPGFGRVFFVCSIALGSSAALVAGDGGAGDHAERAAQHRVCLRGLGDPALRPPPVGGDRARRACHREPGHRPRGVAHPAGRSVLVGQALSPAKTWDLRHSDRHRGRDFRALRHRIHASAGLRDRRRGRSPASRSGAVDDLAGVGRPHHPIFAAAGNRSRAVSASRPSVGFSSADPKTRRPSLYYGRVFPGRIGRQPGRGPHLARVARQPARRAAAPQPLYRACASLLGMPVRAGDGRAACAAANRRLRPRTGDDLRHLVVAVACLSRVGRCLPKIRRHRLRLSERCLRSRAHVPAADATARFAIASSTTCAASGSRCLPSRVRRGSEGKSLRGRRPATDLFPPFDSATACACPAAWNAMACLPPSPFDLLIADGAGTVVGLARSLPAESEDKRAIDFLGYAHAGASASLRLFVVGTGGPFCEVQAGR